MRKQYALNEVLELRGILVAIFGPILSEEWQIVRATPPTDEKERVHIEYAQLRLEIPVLLEPHDPEVEHLELETLFRSESRSCARRLVSRAEIGIYTSWATAVNDCSEIACIVALRTASVF